MTHNRVHLYLSDETLAILDARRGPAPRSAYLRHLIEQAVIPSGPVQPYSSPSPRAAEVTHAADTGQNRHLHKFKKVEVYRRFRGQEFWLRRCECGLEKVDG